MGIPSNPNSQPGGGSFPIFSGNSVPSVKSYKLPNNEWLVVAQFDFSSANGMTVLKDAAGNQLRAFYVDFSALVQNVILPRFKSLFVSIDFDPLLSTYAPYQPLQIADNSYGQLIYVGGFQNLTANGLKSGGKVTASIPLICQPGNVWMCSKYGENTGNIGTCMGAGVAIFSTQDLPPYYSGAMG